jgi:hypothetical protein
MSRIWLLVRSGDAGSDLEKTTLNDTWLVVSQLTAALLLRPQLAADPLPAIPGGIGQTVVLPAAVARARGAAVRPALIVCLVEVRHRVVAHRRSTGRCERIIQTSWAISAA